MGSTPMLCHHKHIWVDSRHGKNHEVQTLGDNPTWQQVTLEDKPWRGKRQRRTRAVGEGRIGLPGI